MYDRAEGHAVAPGRGQIRHLDRLVIPRHLLAPLEQVLARGYVAHAVTGRIGLLQVERPQGQPRRAVLHVFTGGRRKIFVFRFG